MKALAKTMAAAVVAGSLAGGAAMAQDTAVELTESQEFAVGLVLEFNTCVQTGYNDPAYIEGMEAYEEASNAAGAEYDRAYDEWLNGVDAEWHDQEDAIVEQFIEDNQVEITALQDAMAAAEEAYYDATTAEAEAEALEGYESASSALYVFEELLAEIIEAQIGPHPDEPSFPELTVEAPADPEDVCYAAAAETAESNGTDLSAVGRALEEVYYEHGAETYERLVTPAPAP